MTQLWAQAALGLQFAAVVYRAYIASTLGVLLQLGDLPETWERDEARLLRALVPGLYRWCLPHDLHGLRRDFSFPREFADVRKVALAAKLRVTLCEGRRSGGLQHRGLLRRLVAAERNTTRLLWPWRWRDWFQCQKLEQAVKAVRQAGISEAQARELAAGSPQPWTRQQKRRADGQLQRAVGTLLRAADRRFPETRMRNKLENWQTPLFPRHRAIWALQ